jgi:predicted nucleic acid-binding protein
MEKRMETLEKTTVYLPAETRRQLAEVARRRNVTQAELIREGRGAGSGRTGSRVITLDSSAIIAVTNADDPDHETVTATLLAEPEPWLIPEGILAEVAFMLEKLGADVLDSFLQDIENGPYTLEDSRADIPRIRVLAHRYSNLPLGFSDAAVIACAERNRGRVLSIDHRDFQIVARERTITLLPGSA